MTAPGRSPPQPYGREGRAARALLAAVGGEVAVGTNVIFLAAGQEHGVSDAQVQDTEDHHQAATEPDTVHHPASKEGTVENQASSGPATRPTRVKMKPRWNGGPEWIR